MGRRPEPETIDVDPPREPIRPDQGYRVGARIAVGDAGRTRLAGVIAAGIVLAGIAFAAIGPLLPAIPELPVAPAPSRTIATALPDVSVLRPPGPDRLLPVYAGGLRWLDPRTGLMSGDPYTAARTGLFVDMEGHGLCVCLEIPWSQDQIVTRVTLRRYSAAGEEIGRVTLDELVSVKRGVSGDAIQVDAAIAPDGRHLWIVHAVRAAQSWEIGLDRVDLATLEVEASLALDAIPAPRLDDSAVIDSPAGWITRRESAVRASLRVSPDGSKLAVLVSVRSDPRAGPRVPPYQEARFDVGSDLEEATVATAVPVHDASEDRCDAELSGWATNRHFVTICSRPEGEGIQPFVRIENPGDMTRDLAVGPPVGARDTEWLLDARSGVLHRWSSLAHVFTRLEVSTRAMTTLAIDRTRAGTGDLGTWPAPNGGGAPWAPLTGADLLFRPVRLAGSADGTVIYALGFRSVADNIRDDGIASTGIWVFDAGRTELIAHWAPEALYDQIGFMPGWEQLVTLGRPGSDADGGQADWSTSLRFHDPRNGEVVEVLGDVSEPSGFVPAILAPNVPRGIAGF